MAAVPALQDVDATIELLQVEGVVGSSNGLSAGVVDDDGTGIGSHIAAHLEGRCLVDDILQHGGLGLGYLGRGNREVVITVGHDVIIGQLLAIVPVVENQVEVATVGIQQEHLVVGAIHDGIAHTGFAGPCAEEFAVTPSIQSQGIPTGQVVDKDVVL